MKLAMRNRIDLLIEWLIVWGSFLAIPKIGIDQWQELYRQYRSHRNK
jgi:hypothetical protein